MKQITLVSMLMMAVIGCGVSEDGAPGSELGVITSGACTMKSNWGWYKHPNRNYICYYAEMQAPCGETLWAYNRRLDTNVLATGWGAQFAYACHPWVNGLSYRGQWAIGSSAYTKHTIPPYTGANLFYYPATLPRVNDYSFTEGGG